MSWMLEQYCPTFAEPLAEEEAAEPEREPTEEEKAFWKKAFSGLGSSGDGLGDNLGKKHELPPGVDAKQTAADAKQIFDSLDKINEDEDAVFETFLGKTPDEIEAIRQEYAKHYGQSLDFILKDTGCDEALEYVNDPVKGFVKGLIEAGEQDHWGSEEDKIHLILDKVKDPEQLKAIQEEYEQWTGHSLSAALHSELGKSDEDLTSAQMLDVGKAPGDKVHVQAAKLNDAMNNCGFLGLGIGTDEDSVNAIIENTNDKKALAKAYSGYAGETLEDGLSDELTGWTDSKLDHQLPLALLEGKKAEAMAIKLKLSATGPGTNEQKLYGAMEGYSPEEIKAGLAYYNSQWGNAQHMFKEELGDGSLDLKKAMDLAATGKVSDVTALELALHGWNDGDAIKKTLKNKSKEEIAAILNGLDTSLYGDDLVEDLKSMGGADGFAVKQALKGKPTTVDEKVAYAKEAYAFETSGLDGLADAFTDSDEMLEAQQAQINLLYLKHQKGGLTADEERQLDTLIGYQDLDIESHKANKDAITTGAVTAITTALPIFAPFMPLLKDGMQGDAYGLQDYLVDGGALATQQAATHAADGLSMDNVTGLSASDKVLSSAFAAGTGAGITGLGGALLDKKNYQGDTLDFAGGVLKATAVAAGSAAATSVVGSALQAPGSGTVTGNGTVAEKTFAGGLSGVLGGLFQTAVDPKSWESQAAFLKAMVINGTMGGVTGAVTAKNETNASDADFFKAMHELPGGWDWHNDDTFKGLNEDWFKPKP